MYYQIKICQHYHHYHITTSPHHHITTSPPHHLTISPSHHLTISPSHHLVTKNITTPRHLLAAIPPACSFQNRWIQDAPGMPKVIRSIRVSFCSLVIFLYGVSNFKKEEGMRKKEQKNKRTKEKKGQSMKMGTYIITIGISRWSKTLWRPSECLV